jgi:predicted nucleic acid-binding protein
VSGFLLDTNVISEVLRPKPDPRVARWFESTEEALLLLSVLTIGEIRKGIAMIIDPARKNMLETWLTSNLVIRFAGRILPIDEAVAAVWGQITGTLARKGFLVPVIDGLLASTALHHNLTLVTRNTRDVAPTGVAVLDPWMT